MMELEARNGVRPAYRDAASATAMMASAGGALSVDPVLEIETTPNPEP